MQGTIRSRSPGSWTLQWYVGRDEAGKPKYKTATIHGKKSDAQAELRRILREIETGQYIDPSKLTVGEFLDEWLATCAKGSVSAKTYERYAEITHGAIVPALGRHQLLQLRPQHIQAFYTECLKSGRKRNGKSTSEPRKPKGEKPKLEPGLSPQTVLHYHRLLHRALEQAVKWQMLPRNPCDVVEPPRVPHREMKVFSPEEIGQILQAAKNRSIYMPIVIAVYTGMRRGEVLGLRWEDVDLDAGILYLRRSLEETSAGLRFKEPKSARGRRTIHLPATLVDELRQHRERQSEEKQLAPEYIDQGIVCAYPDGQPIPPDYISSNFRYVLKRAGLPQVPFHTLRHTHATMLLTRGVHPKVVQERLGHSTIAITMDIYSHVMPSLQAAAAEQIDNLLG